MRLTTWPWAVLALFVSSLAMQPSEAQLAQCDSPSIGWPASQCTLPCLFATEECTPDQIIPVSCPCQQSEQKQTMHGLEISRALSARLAQIGLSFCGFPVPYVRRVICITPSLSHALFCVFSLILAQPQRDPKEAKGGPILPKYCCRCVRFGESYQSRMCPSSAEPRPAMVPVESRDLIARVNLRDSTASTSPPVNVEQGKDSRRDY